MPLMFSLYLATGNGLILICFLLVSNSTILLTNSVDRSRCSIIYPQQCHSFYTELHFHLFVTGRSVSVQYFYLLKGFQHDHIKIINKYRGLDLNNLPSRKEQLFYCALFLLFDRVSQHIPSVLELTRKAL